MSSKVEILLRFSLFVADYRFQTNRREDEYSVDGDNALRLLHRIVLGIRKSVPKDFVLGIKLNAGDYVDGMTCQDRALDHVCTIASWNRVDFIEISGGDYENPGAGTRG
jgi:2,4-dienoyl-CoA reductase-like NADH-dependent reductase (Old Yellow Enzyme family)